MGILSKLAMAPLAPVAGVVWLAEQLEAQAYEQLYGPEAVRARLEDLARLEAIGEITPEQRALAEDELFAELEHHARPPS